MTGFEKRISGKLSKLNDEQVEQVFDTLNEGREMVKAVLDSLLTGLIVCDNAFRIIVINKSASKYIPFTTTATRLHSTKIPVWNLVLDCDVSDFLHSAFKKGSSSVCREFTLEATGGKLRFISISLIPFVRKNKIEGTIIAIDDVTEKRSQETQLRRMESLASLTTLAANVAHEIKNPLGSISIHIQLLQKAIQKARQTDGLLPNEKFLEKYLNVVNEEISRLNGIVVDFLFAVRPVNASLSLYEPNELLIQFLDFCRPELAEKKIELQINLTESAPKLLLDEKLFRQVVLNIVQNAQAAMSQGGILLVSTLVKDDLFILTIADNGIGMDEETSSHIFEPYFTTKTAGTGLGLTMVYKIIKEFSGDIRVQSALGKGTIFSISIPVPQRERRLLGFSKEKG